MSLKQRYSFRGVAYPFDTVKKAACDVSKVDPDLIEDEEDLDVVIDRILKGPPTPCSKFIVALNEWEPR